jgi:hypothetical protein
MTVKRGGRGFGHTCRVSGHAGDGATVTIGKALREDGSFALREDGSYALREA